MIEHFSFSLNRYRNRRLLTIQPQLACFWSARDYFDWSFLWMNWKIIYLSLRFCLKLSFLIVSPCFRNRLQATFRKWGFRDFTKVPMKSFSTLIFCLTVLTIVHDKNRHTPTYLSQFHL